MAEADLSKIVGLIMENPEIIEKIKELSSKSEAASDSKESAPENKSSEAVSEQPPISTAVSSKRAKRKELLYALKSYVSEERGRAIESMLSIADILDLMKTR